MSAKDIIRDAKVRMDKAINALHHDLAKVRTGRATPAILDSVMVDYYGQSVPINQAATVSVPEPRLIVVQPWEKSFLAAFEKAIMKADLGLNPSNDGDFIRIPIPQLSEERRKDMVKLVKQFGENGKIAVRNIRRDANDHLKKMEKNHELSEDELSVELDEIKDITEGHVKKIEEVLAEKEKELLEI
ncbi:MAG: ribosome recycling factor [Calditrichaeota bacterium]|nr:MAG: ribosome recycling factor [Calditrichota bacterium]MBL1206362.1 ribosome recycling factor [Calditrichota bacterium]NOG46188.1 ribosome recycling factor [Calditrichota bacterium]